MKLFKKLAIAFTCALCAACVCLAFSACESSNPDDNLADGTYVFYVYLDDGTTPVENVTLQICNGEVCFLPVTTDESGRAELTIDLTTYTIGNEFCVHFYSTDDLPDGYGLPSGGQTISSYANAWYITSQVTTLTLTKA